MRTWPLAPGELIKRTELHARFGGSRYSGISPSRTSPNVFVFSDPNSGEQHGYIDDWKDDGCFHYTGEGQRGQQQMTKGNLALLRAARDRRAVRVFEGSGGDVRYTGEFALDEIEPWYYDDAPETGGGPIRPVIVFRLRPLDTLPQPPRGLPARSPTTHVADVPVEERNTERMVVSPDREPYEAERRESELVHRFKRFIEAQGYEAKRKKIVPAGEAKPLFTDLYVDALDLLVEAKGSTDRISIRMAIGQLMDYRRFLKPTARCAVLVPSLPRRDLMDLLGCAGVEIYCPSESDGQSFVHTRPTTTPNRLNLSVIQGSS
jgi:hypothetical protein